MVLDRQSAMRMAPDGSLSVFSRILQRETVFWDVRVLWSDCLLTLLKF